MTDLSEYFSSYVNVEALCTLANTMGGTDFAAAFIDLNVKHIPMGRRPREIVTAVTDLLKLFEVCGRNAVLFACMQCNARRRDILTTTLNDLLRRTSMSSTRGVEM